MSIETRVFGEYFLKLSVHKNSYRICYKFLKKHSIKVDLNCLDPGNVHLSNLNASVLNVLICSEVPCSDVSKLNPAECACVEHSFSVRRYIAS